MGQVSEKVKSARGGQRQYHFIGIGGIGMGGLASLMLEAGHTVTGSDVRENAMVQKLRVQGAQIIVGHKEDNVAGADFIVYSSAIKDDNPELQQAHIKNIPTVQRAELLAMLVNQQCAITVAGAHGKTTTTSMIAQVLHEGQLNPAVAIGGLINDGSNHASLGQGQYFVAEVDESDGSFLHFTPEYSIITNIDFEHIDYYKNWDNILATYTQFINRTKANGCLIVNGDDEHLKKLLPFAPTQVKTFGFSPTNDVYAQSIQTNAGVTHFDAYKENQCLGSFELKTPGKHNVLNALATIVLGLEIELSVDVLQKGLKDFSGVQRRFQKKGEVNGITVIDDYGHHPTEIAHTLQTAQSLGYNRVISVFQPHRYSRTKFLMDDFVKSLSLSDLTIVTDIYAASEQPIEGVDAHAICDRLQIVHHQQAIYLKKEDIAARLVKVAEPGDLVITLGAGDINKVGMDFLNALKGDVASLGRIGVLMGGYSSEAEISLKSGQAVLSALKQAGCDTVEVNISASSLEEVKDEIVQANIDLAFVALHGELGEDGKIQSILEELNISYAGSGVEANQKTINKATTQTLFKKNNIPVPEFQVLNQKDYVDNYQSLLEIKFPLVIKPAEEGSSIGITIVENKDDLKASMHKAFAYGNTILLEKYIKGREFTVGVLGDETLPVIEIVPKNPFFDFSAKYESGMTEYVVPANISVELSQKLKALALKAHKTLGCEDLSRTDFMVDENGQIYTLEINTIPGFTSTSLVPKAAAVKGINFTELCLTLVRMAHGKKKEKISRIR